MVVIQNSTAFRIEINTAEALELIRDLSEAISRAHASKNHNSFVKAAYVENESDDSQHSPGVVTVCVER